MKKVIVHKPIEVGFHSPSSMNINDCFDIVEEHEYEPPVYSWSEWETYDVITEEDVSYSVQNRDINIFKSEVVGLHPYHKRRYLQQRTLVVVWTCPIEGKKAKTLKRETREIS